VEVIRRSLKEACSSKVVLVNDDEGVLTKTLSAEGINTVLVGGTPKSIRGVLGKVKPNLVIVNVDGCIEYGKHICKDIKEDKTFRNIPVIFVSSNEKPEDRRDAFLFGCLDYIEKPYEDDRLLAKVRSYISLGSVERSIKSLLVHLESRCYCSEKVA